MVLFCERIFGPVKITNAIAVNTNESVTRELFATVVVLKLQRKKYAANGWGIFHWLCLLPISGISDRYPIKSVICSGLPTKKLDSIIYYERYVVINPGVKRLMVLKSSIFSPKKNTSISWIHFQRKISFSTMKIQISLLQKWELKLCMKF
jgi:DNA-directed RNA polymerase subunit beta'